MLPLLLAPALPARADAPLLAAVLHLLAELVRTATGAMLIALSDILGNVFPILRIAQTGKDTFLEEILRRAGEHHSRCPWRRPAPGARPPGRAASTSA